MERFLLKEQISCACAILQLKDFDFFITQEDVRHEKWNSQVV